jgi:two-component system, cell cycle response regulator DivK
MCAQSHSAALSVLLVQPHDDSLDLYCEYLGHQGINCLAVTNVADAIDVAHRADIIVTGIRLQGSADGVELIDHLRANEHRSERVPIIVLTACAFESERRRAERAGCDAFLAKPCLPSDLYCEIRRVLSATRLRRVRGRAVKSRGQRVEAAEKASGD